MNYYFILPLIALFTNLVLGLYIILLNPNSKKNRSYFLITIALAIWSISNILVFTSSNAEIAYFHNKIGLVGSVLAAFFILRFLILYTNVKIPNKNIFFLIYSLLALFFIILSLFTNVIAEQGHYIYWGYTSKLGLLYTPYITYIIVSMLIGFFFLFKFYFNSNSKKRKQISLIIIAIIIPFIGGVFSEVVPAAFGFELIPLSTFFSTIMAVIIAFAISRHGLMAPVSFSIRRKILAGFMIIIVLIICSSTIYINFSRDSLINSVGNNAKLFANEALDKIERAVFQRVENINLYANSASLKENIIDANNQFELMDNIQEYIAEMDDEWINTDSGEITVFMQNIIDNNMSDELRDLMDFFQTNYNYSVFSEIFITNKYGANIAQTSKTSDYYQADEEWWQISQQNSSYISDVEYDNSAGVYSIEICKSIYDDNSFIGVIKSVFNIEEIFRIIESIKQDEEMSLDINLYTHERLILYSTEDYNFLEDNSQELSSFYKSAEENNHQDYLIVQRDLNKGQELLVHAHSAGQNDYSRLNWILMIEYEIDEIFEPINDITNTIIIFSITTIFFGLLFSYYVSRSISQPVIKLSDIARNIGEGNLTENIDVKTKDEVGVLAKTIKNMMIDLKKSKEEVEEYQTSMESLVKKRTKALEESRLSLNQKIMELESNRSALLNILDDLEETHNTLENLNKELETQNKQLIKLDRIKSEFLNITSHELRTPISAIKGYVQMVMSQKLGNISEEQEKAFSIILRNTNRLDNLIRDILDISRLESGTMRFVSKSTDIKKLTTESLEALHPQASNKDIKINSDFDEFLPDLIIDEERIKQVMMNIVSNAIKFSPDGSFINVRVKKQESDILFEIEDFGKGIPKDKQKNVFKAFYQVDSGMDRKFGGAGLGLAICKGIIISHGGDIWVESTIKKGSTFKFILPIKEIKDVENRFKDADIFGLNDSSKGNI